MKGFLRYTQAKKTRIAIAKIFALHVNTKKVNKKSVTT